jgi:hypothetical protein
MKAGDTFRPADRSVDIHLWVIISDPLQDDSRVLIVSLTTFKPKKEPTCLLNIGDHPAISHTTCVAYGLANAPSLAQLEQARADGHLIPAEPVSVEILARIREGAALSKKLAIDYGELLDSQGLL